MEAFLPKHYCRQHMYLEGKECSQFDDFWLEDINRQFVNLHTIWLVVRLDLEDTQLNTTTLQGLTCDRGKHDKTCTF